MITGKDEKYILKTKMSGEVTNLHFMLDVYKIIHIFSPGWRQTSILYWEKIWTNILHPIKLFSEKIMRLFNVIYILTWTLNGKLLWIDIIV